MFFQTLSRSFCARDWIRGLFPKNPNFTQKTPQPGREPPAGAVWNVECCLCIEFMTDSPAVVFKHDEPVDRQDGQAPRKWIHWLALLLLAAGGLGWTLFKMDVHHESAQPGQTPTKADAAIATPSALANSTPAAASDPARRYGVKVGDTVEISSLNPAVAATHAIVTAMTARQLSIRVGSDTFDIRWENLDRLKPVRKK